MIVTEAPLTQPCLRTSPIHTLPSLSYNRPVQIKHTYNYVLTRVLIQVTIQYNTIHTRTHTERLSLVFAPSFPQFFPLGICTEVCSVHPDLINSWCSASLLLAITLIAVRSNELHKMN
ncbi:unnamed protein product [Hymenolepis diminuta]|uniref:Uncharacterized protein n=1 Tax=Hymenolepis diminuta TaxID=6216 RepID=A0A564Z3X8_HYMDI|nr:unnamed protein product [Hymenolepis diminuta]